MGIKSLNKLLQKYASNACVQKNLSDYSGKIIAIDTSLFLYKFISMAKNGLPYEFLLAQIIDFLRNGIIPVYVFDGKPPVEKNATLLERRERKQQLQERKLELETQIAISTDDKEIRNLKKELEKTCRFMIYITPEIIRETQLLFDAVGIPYLHCDGEAEVICSRMIKAGIAFGCLSEDMDVLANGGRIMLRNYAVYQNTVMEYNLDVVLEKLELSYSEFVDLCILCGCDYTGTIKNVGVERAYRFIKKHRKIETVLAMEIKDSTYFAIPADFNYRRARELFFGNNAIENIELGFAIRPARKNELLGLIEKYGMRPKLLEELEKYHSFSPH